MNKQENKKFNKKKEGRRLRVVENEEKMKQFKVKGKNTKVKRMEL